MSSQQTTDLIAFGATAVWPFNDTSGSTTASDATGNGHTANFAHVGTSPNTFGVSATQTNDSETCVQCGGSNAGFNAPASSAWAIGTSDFSAGVWAKISSMGSNPIVLMGQYSSIGGDPVWWLGIDSNGKPCHTLGSNSPSDASGSIVDGNWHQVILTGQNGSGNRAIKLYVDGVHQSGADLNYNSNLGMSTHAFGILNFSEDSGPVDFSSAGLDAKKAFLINGTALTQAQVTQLYNDATSSGGGGGGGTGTIAVNNSNWFFSPYNWYVNGSTYAQTVNPGAYFKVAFSGTSCSLNVDVSPLSGAGSSNFPKIAYSLDGQTLQTVQLPASSGAAFSLSGLTNTTHTLTCYMKCSSQGIDRWNTPVNVFRVTGLTLDSGASLSAPTLGTKRYLFFGDSITEGVNTLATSGNVNNDLTDNDGTLTWAALFARSQNVEYGIVGFGYQGWVHNGNGNVPDLYYSLTNLWAGQTRSFATKPDHVIINMGTNDVSGNGITLTQSNVTTALTELRGLIGTAPVTVLIPFGGYNSSTLTNAVASLNDANTSTADFSALGTYLISGTLALSADGLHPNQYADQILADAMETSAAFNGTNSAAASGPVISVF